MKAALRLLLIPLAVICAASQAKAQQPQPWQILSIQDKETALVYELFYRPGRIDYLESQTNGSEPISNFTNVPSIQNSPERGFWRTKEQRGERIFGTTSASPSLTSKSSTTLGNAAIWVFRQNQSAPPSAVILGLRNPRQAVGTGGVVVGGNPVTATITLPPRSAAYSSMIFRKGIAKLQVSFEQTYFTSDDEYGDFFKVATNNTDSPMDIKVSGLTVVNEASGGTIRYMALRGKPAGDGVFLLTGNFADETSCFAAAVVISPLP